MRCTLFYTFAFIITIPLGILWTFKPRQQWEYFIKLLNEEYERQDFIFNHHKQYWIYRTPWDFVIYKKTWIDNPTYDRKFDILYKWNEK